MVTDSYHDPLPLDYDVRWWGITQIAERLIKRLGFGPDAVRDLQEALEQGRLRCMFRSDREEKRRIFAPEEWAALKLQWSESDRCVNTVYRETRKFYWGRFYIWLPDFEALWPTVSPGAAKEPALAPPTMSVATKTFPERGSPNAHERRKAERAERKAARQTEKRRRVTAAVTWLKENMPTSLNYAELREKPESKRADPFTQCKAVILDLSFNEFSDAVKAERDRRRALEP